MRVMKLLVLTTFIIATTQAGNIIEELIAAGMVSGISDYSSAMRFHLRSHNIRFFCGEGRLG